MKIVDSIITRKELIEISLKLFKTMTKAVVDIEKGMLIVDAELHSDLENCLLENGSEQENLWGINLYPSKDKDDFIEWTSLINIRPHQDNFSMEVENPDIREKIKKVVFALINYDA